ncbi:cobalt-precorrin-6Y C(5)-methyltransferase [[Clostridium] sordellii]|uniref:Cobalt-precorrin-6Y C(5)-methyltransferase n=1 Tax=Paraclostridium sordellii TaxID=1505 RepID=A0A0A8VT71_PARSO|nr:cobalt-precorrin-7 (C(5))-methyltransferase [Paeniclostridium sordellii]MBS6025554.1 cobalt-precorrin-7 (C(5))-methyltransferase [Paeniclostridium sordellii]MCH1964680.1 cobalt-precorrin-7 (C(5))-methyltransferase [Paeniclostridium sordellii]MCH1967652.1 cobalt-precorrin-7 (C(5))-methyltransferase [Paeniclostridium sordellii]QYE97800.1 cobalt-precorrin-7 (C(5))-methyltransferase [Paeniclostridium sordellii]TAN66447.1 cobalt-precorrin-7 (C(5))-methyltransferase [Paeniclostridium sordellii 84
MINIIGLGPGNIGYCTNIGKELIYKSDVIIGGKRNLESIKEFRGEKIELNTNLKYIVEYLKNNKHKNISIIASGDPLIYGIGKFISNNIEKENLNIVSGISSMQYIFSKIGVDMNDLYITSSHGKVPDFDYILNHSKVCMVTDNKIGPVEIAKEILSRDLNKIMVVGENLSYEDEKITILSPEKILEVKNFDMNVVVILDEE